MSNELRIEGYEELFKRLEGMPAHIQKQAKGAVNATAQGIRSTAIRSIQSHHSAGRTYTKYSPKREHTASAPGNPPNTDTGRLVGSIQVHDTGKLSAEVVAGVNYAAHLEFGTRHMAARPFMVPAVEAERPKFDRRLAKIDLGK